MVAEVETQPSNAMLPPRLVRWNPLSSPYHNSTEELAYAYTLPMHTQPHICTCTISHAYTINDTMSNPLKSHKHFGVVPCIRQHVYRQPLFFQRAHFPYFCIISYLGINEKVLSMCICLGMCMYVHGKEWFEYIHTWPPTEVKRNSQNTPRTAGGSGCSMMLPCWSSPRQNTNRPSSNLETLVKIKGDLSGPETVALFTPGMLVVLNWTLWSMLSSPPISRHCVGSGLPLTVVLQVKLASSPSITVLLAGRLTNTNSALQTEEFTIKMRSC